MDAFSGPTAELHQLVAALCDQTIDRAGSERLAELLRGDPEAQWFYVCYLHLHATLGWIGPTALSLPQASNGRGTPAAGDLGPVSLLVQEAEAYFAAGVGPPLPVTRPPPLPHDRPSPRRPAGPPPLSKARRKWRGGLGRLGRRNTPARRSAGSL